ncbi:hypothetical protein PENSUB_5423 [Penicillium subrubescens]|uniref:Uncharacterized protein n=1 Tax=Penicillium subrubescens TaxID=1316194 RepID=A0A1Q5U9R1_9EURO|nr:hypothetical protein PENSUB_5423 [Penicillium subrubescens]
MRHGYGEIFDLLIKHKARTCGGDECPIVEAVKYHRLYEVRVLVRLGVCVHWDEALSFALNNRPIFDLMVENGVEIKKYGHMALHGAITEGKKDWVEFLISEGADPNLSLPTESVIEGGEKNYSSIYYAILHGHLDVCKFLIKHGVQPEEDDLELAREKGYDEISEIIPAWLQLSNDGLPIYQVYLLETAGQTKPLLFYFTGEVDIELRLAVFGYEFTDM